MKKNYKTKSMMRLLITLMLMATLLLGCSSTEAETETAAETAKPQVEAPAEEPAEVEKEEAPVEETKPEETETTEAETEATEAETEATEEDPAEEVAENPGEVTYITDYTSISEYMGSLDPNKPAIVIYNEDEGYIINMQEGQHYQLKKADQILLDRLPKIGEYLVPIEGISLVSYENYVAITNIDYSKLQPKHEFFFGKVLDNGEEIRLTCYFDPPVE